MTDQRNNHLTGNGLSREAVKFIAILTMTGNHAAIALLPPGFLHSLLVNIGYFTAAVMCFFLERDFGIPVPKGAMESGFCSVESSPSCPSGWRSIL